MTETRTETGGPARTPRSEISAAVPANRKKEPALLLDLSASMDRDAATWMSTGRGGHRREVPDGR